MSDFIVYSKTNCPQCVQAKNMITAAGKTYTERLFGYAKSAVGWLMLLPKKGVKQ